MKAFSRVFKYVWPQWPRVVVVVVSAMLVSVLLVLSFMTIIPLLKVMMGQEGLHGWVDRKICKYNYGMEFYIPEVSDFASTSSKDILNSLRVTHVKAGSPSDKAGIRPDDRIIAATDAADDSNVPYFGLLQVLAYTDETSLPLQIRRFNESTEKFERLSLTMSGKGIISPDASMLARAKEAIQSHLINIAQKSMAYLPRENTNSAKIKSVIFIMIAITIVTIIRCIAKFYQTYLAEKVVQVGLNKLRTDAFSHVMDMPMGYFSNQRPSDVVSRLIRDTGQMGSGIKLLLGKALREPMNAAAMLTGAAIINWQLTLIFLCGGPSTILAVSVLGRKMKKASKKSLVAWSEMLSRLQEVMAGLKVVKVYNQQTNERNRFETINQRLLKQLLRISRIDSATMPLLEVLGMLAGAVAIVAGVKWVADNKIEGSEFLVMLGFLGGAAEAIRKTSDLWNKIQEANAASERVFAIMDEPQELETKGAIKLSALKDKIEFRNITFTYPGCAAPALKGINVIVPAGHNVAIVGPNGSGKTTLANLLPRFYDPDTGSIFIDGTDIRDVTYSSLRDQIGLVTQNTVTFNDTIFANIAYAKPDALKEDVIAAAKRAYAHEFITALPQGYDTIIGENATGLSGGQLQRLAIARAILKNPPILIFDEATSQVDADSEAKIRSAIEEILRNRTCFIIAHRFSTVVSADLIVVIDQGNVIAQGRHEELIRTCPLYHTLYETQLVKA